MDSFLFYLREGIFHISDLNGIDHLLFIAAICIPLQFSDYRKIFFSVTAFTIGHMLSLVLSTYELIQAGSLLIEWLIPCTIVISALINILHKSNTSPRTPITLLLIGLFGIIHGLGFSNYLKSMLGKEETLLLPLLGFNTGLEIGQLMIVAGLLLLNFAILHFTKTKQREWVLFASGGIFGLAMQMAIERWPF